jgi:hypothetical protein
MMIRTLTKAAFAAAVALSALAGPSFAASVHTQRGHAQIVNHPGILHPTPSQLGWGNECVEDEGQGRYFPCDAAGGN